MGSDGSVVARAPVVRLALLGGSVALAAILGFTYFDPATAIEIVRSSAAWLMAGLFGCFLYYAVRSIPWAALKDRQLWRRHLMGLLAIALVSSYLISREPADFKVLMDEIVLASSAMNLHFERDPGVMTRGHDLFGVFRCFESYLDKRPMFYPFVVSLAHGILGYRVENSFLVNRCLAVALCALLYGLACRLQDVRAGILALCLIAGVPLVAQIASSGSCEMLAAVMLLASMHFALSYSRQPSGVFQAGLVLSLVLLAHTRSDHGLFVFVGAALILCQWWRLREVDVHWVLIVAPLTLVTLPLQTAVFKINPDLFWQLRPGVTSPFGLEFVAENLKRAGGFLFTFSRGSYSSALVAWLGVPAVVGLIVSLARQRGRRRVELRVLGAYVVGGAVLFLVIMGYYWGQLDDFEASRLALTTFVLMAVLVGVVLLDLFPRAWRVAVVVAVAYVYAYSVPASAIQYASLRDNEMRRINWCWQQYQRLPAGRYLVISPDRLFWGIHRIGAVLPPTADEYVREISFHFNRRSFADVLVVQRFRIDPVTGEESCLANDALSAAFRLETLAEASFQAYLVCRFQRVAAIDLSRTQQWDVGVAPPQRPGVSMEPIERRYIQEYIRALP